MKYFYVHPDDARWLARWLRSNLTAMLVLGGLLLCIPSEPGYSGTSRVVADQRAVTSEQLPPEPTRVLLTTRPPNPIAPQGWRRTAKGWEHTSTWPAQPRPLGEWIQAQEAREPAWAQHLLARLREIPPALFALLQIAAIGAIVFVSKRAQSSRLATGEAAQLARG